MVKVLEGQRKGKGKRVAIVVGRFNEFITKKLCNACVSELIKQGVSKNAITVTWVPGSFEIPATALRLSKKKSIDAVICLGAVLQGETLHYELVAREAAHGIMNASLLTQKPIIFEILAARKVKLLEERAKVKGHNKGRVAAQTALEMIDLYHQL